MEVKNVDDCLILPNSHPLQQRVLHQIAKNAWNNLLIKDEECIFILRETEKLIAHREKVLKNLPRTFSNLPKRLKCKLFNAVYCLQQGYSEAVTWEDKCKSALPFSIFDHTTAGKYLIDNFIDPLGHFKELEWAKCFVDDEKQFMVNRFVLACFYCFDKQIEYFWRTMKINKLLPCQGRLAGIKSRYKQDDLVVIWAYQLENRFDDLMRASAYYSSGYNLSGLFDAISHGHEYAARYFWNRLSENERKYFFRKPEFSLLADAAEGNHAGVVSFIYSQLKEKHKKELVSNIIKDNSLASILSCLLASQYYESVLNDIIKPTFPIPTVVYKWILISLSFVIAELQISRHKEIFKELWKNLTQENRKEVLEGDSYMIMNFVKIKDMDLIKTIIQPLPQSEKNRMLLNDRQKAGISALDDFSFGGNYDGLRRYLLFFFTDYCPVNKKFIMRSDAASVFDEFIYSEDFILFTEMISDSEEKAINKFVEELKVVLEIPNLLIE